MKLCENCEQPTKNPKYCCKSCAAKVNNKLTPKRTIVRKCANCGKPCKSGRHKHCDVCIKEGNVTKSKNSPKSTHKMSKEEAIAVIDAFINRDYKAKDNEKRRIKRLCVKFGIEIDNECFKTRRLTRHTKELLEPIIASSKSYAECLRKLNLVEAGGNYRILQRNIDKFELDTSHMTHQAHNKGLLVKKFDDLVSNDAIKKRLILEKGHRCECCLNTHWLSKLITLELEHVDGNNRNNEKSNLKLLCPNCHSQTDTWRGRKLK